MAQTIDFIDMLEGLENTGFYEVALPFLLIFTISFGVLQKIQMFGKDSKKYNVVIALIMAFLVVRMTPIVANMNQFLPKVSWVVLVFIMTLMVLGIFGAKAEGFKGMPFAVAVLLSIGGIIWSLSPTTKLPAFLQLTFEDKMLLAGIGVFIVAIYFITKEGGSASDKIRKGFHDLPGEFGR